MEIKKSILSRVGVVYVVTFVVALAILGQVLYIQMSGGEELRAKAESLSEQHRPIPSSRGNILDRNGNVLASSVTRFDVVMDPSSKAMDPAVFEKEINALTAGLHRLFPEKSAAEYTRMIRSARNRGGQWVVLHRDATYDEAKEVSKLPLFNLGQFKGGLILSQVNTRENPYKRLARRTIGYVSEDETVVGIEGAFDYDLKGTDGQRLEQRIGGGTWIPVSTDNEVDPIDGKDVVTTLDVNYQDVAESALYRCLVDYQAEYGCAVLMDVPTGEILAMANLGRAGDGDYYELKNYAINDCLEPGSTFKIPAIMAALEGGNIKPTDTVNTFNGRFMIHGQQVTDAHTGGYGLLTVEEVVEHSSNIGMARLIDRLYSKNPELFLERLYGLGINKPLNLKISGGQDPRIRTTSDPLWSAATVAWMAFGYEVEMTPLQILTFYNAIANNGTMMKPMLVKSLMSHSHEYREFKPEVMKSSICSRQTLSIVRKMLEGVVQKGTATNLKDSLYQIAGKTGTAVISQAAGGYRNSSGHKDYRASFVGYFPADNPRYSCIVVVSRPTGPSYYGAVVSGSVFKAISDKVFATNLDLQKNLSKPKDKLINELPVVYPGNWTDAGTVLKSLGIPVTGVTPGETWARVIRKDDRLLAAPVPVRDTVLPNFVGMGLKDVLPVLENRGIRVKVKGSGRIVGQYPPAGSAADSVKLIEFQLAAI